MPSPRANAAFGLSGQNPFEGYLARSTNGEFLTLAGYGASPGAPLVDTPAISTNRVIARVSASGVVDTSTALTSAFDRNDVRSAVSVDGSAYWVSGTSTGAPPSGGVHYVSHGSSTSTRIIDAPNNARVLGLHGGQLHLSSSEAKYRPLSRVGTGVPTTAGQAVTPIAGLEASNEPFGFVLLDRDASVAGPDTLYIANDATAVLKFGFDASSWTLASSVPVSGVIAIAAFDSGPDVRVVATTPVAIVSFLDAKGAPATVLEFADAAPKTEFRGIARAPE